MSGRHAGQPRRAPDARSWVAGVFPVDGPHDAGTLVAACEAVGELARFLAHATHGAHGVLRFAPDAYDVLGRLAGAVYSLVQVCDQVSGQLVRLGDDSTLAVDDLGTDCPPPAVLAGRAATCVCCAQVTARELADQLSAAQAALARLYHAGSQGGGW